MLIQLTIGNCFSFKEKQTFSMVAAPIGEIPENTFSIESKNLKHQLLKSAALYGANANGKSNLIKAVIQLTNFILISSKESLANQPIGLENYRLSTETENTPSYFEVVFYYNDIQYRYGFEADREKVHTEWFYYKPKTKEIEYFFRVEDNIILHEKFTVGKTLKTNKMVRSNALLLSVASQFNDPICNSVTTWIANDFNSISGLQSDYFFQYTLDKLTDESFETRILNLIQEADLGITNFEIISKEISDVKFTNEHTPEQRETLLKVLKGKKVHDLLSIHKKYNENKELAGFIPFTFQASESDGTQKFFNMLGPILDTLDNGKLLIVDELDSHLHPLLSEKIVQLFNSPKTNPKNAQLIFTTHNTNLLSPHLFRRDQIWFTEKDRYGASSLFSLVDYKDENDKKVRNDASFEKAYLQGKYGAIPILGDFENLSK